MQKFFGTPVRKLGASIASTALIIGSMFTAVPPAAAETSDNAVITPVVSLSSAVPTNGISITHGEPGWEYEMNIDCNNILGRHVIYVPAARHSRVVVNYSGCGSLETDGNWNDTNSILQINGTTAGIETAHATFRSTSASDEFVKILTQDGPSSQYQQEVKLNVGEALNVEFWTTSGDASLPANAPEWLTVTSTDRVLSNYPAITFRVHTVSGIPDAPGMYEIPLASERLLTLVIEGGAVTTAPDAPIIDEIAAADAELRVAFTPGSDGGDPVTNYEYSTDDGTTWYMPSPPITSSPLSITKQSVAGTPNLENGTTYGIQLRARNSVGAGAASTTVSATPRTPPAPAQPVAGVEIFKVDGSSKEIGLHIGCGRDGTARLASGNHVYQVHYTSPRDWLSLVESNPLTAWTDALPITNLNDWWLHINHDDRGDNPCVDVLVGKMNGGNPVNGTPSSGAQWPLPPYGSVDYLFNAGTLGYLNIAKDTWAKVSDDQGNSVTIVFSDRELGTDPISYTQTVSGGVNQALDEQIVVPGKFISTPTYLVSPALPAGLDINAGRLVGTPTSPQAQTEYTITTTVGALAARTKLLLEVVPEPPYVISFDTVGNHPEGPPIGQALPDRSVERGSDFTLPAIVNNSNVPIVDIFNHLFVGWYTDVTGGNLVGMPGEAYLPQSNQALFARWSPWVNLLYSLDGGQLPDGVSNPGKVVQGSAVTLPTPIKEGRIFAGWYSQSSSGTLIGLGGQVVAAPTGVPLGNSKTWFARWRSPLILRFDPDGGSVSDNRCVDGLGGWAGTCGITESSTMLLPVATRDGYRFDGWYSSRGKGGTFYGEGGSAPRVAVPGSTRIYAGWTSLVVADTVTFDAGFTGGVAPPPVTTDQNSIDLPDPPDRPGFVFMGWFRDTARAQRVGSAGDSFQVTGNVTLIARWRVPARPADPVNRGGGEARDGNNNALPITVLPVPADNAVDISGNVGGRPFGMNLRGVDATDTPVELAPDGYLILAEDRRVETNGSGFVPESPVSFHLLPPTNVVVAVRAAFLTRQTVSDAISLGILTVDEDGEFEGTLDLPSGLDSGDYLIQAVGIAESGDDLSITLGVRVEATASVVQPPMVFPPGAPATINVTASDRAVHVAWTVPNSTGSFPITNYQVVGQPGGGCLVAEPARSCVITGLTNGVDYTFRVRALNGAGWGSYSNPSAAATPIAEKTPSILVTGTRAEVRGRVGVQVRGIATGLEGSLVTPRVRLGKEDSYSFGVGVRTIGDDGVFVWERITSRWVYVYFVADGVRSNRIVIRRD